MGRLLSFLPEKPQPAWVRYAATTLIMAVCIAVQVGLQNQTGFVGLFFLLPGIVVAGVLFDRKSALYAAALGTTFAYFAISASTLFQSAVAPTLLFAATGTFIGIVAEALRTEMDRAARAHEGKTLLLTELAQRTKNNLALLSAMMRVQARHSEVTASEALGEMAERVQVMAEVYDHLTIRADRKVVDARQYLTDICRHLAASISGTNPVVIKTDADELYISSEQAVPIAIIVNELVTNSLKYAFPDGRAGLIQVTLRTGEEVVLTVKDNGVGAHGDVRESVGSRAVSLLAQQLGATISRESLGPGYSVILRVPLPSV
jgi:two-component sensor histidine kinase